MSLAAVDTVWSCCSSTECSGALLYMTDSKFKFSFIQVLLSNGADKFIKNKSGKVPGQLICRGAVDWLPTSALADVKQHLRSLLV